MEWLIPTTATLGLALAALIGYDLLQRKHAIPHNFPVIGHFRSHLDHIL